MKFKTKKGRTVYGGGGVTPDIFVPFQVKHGEDATFSFMQTGVVSYFVLEQLDGKRIRLSDYTAKELKEEITGSDKYLNAFKKYVTDSGMLLNFNQKEKIKKYKSILANFKK